MEDVACIGLGSGPLIVRGGRDWPCRVCRAEGTDVDVAWHSEYHLHLLVGVLYAPQRYAAGPARRLERQDPAKAGEGGLSFAARGGVDTALWLDPPPPHQHKGSIDGPPKILPRLTPGPRR